MPPRHTSTANRRGLWFVASDTRALFIICCVELLERLVGYLVSVSLVFYLNEALKLSVSEANHLSGWVFRTLLRAGICGGLVSDWLLGAGDNVAWSLALGIAVIGATVMQTIPLWLWGLCSSFGMDCLSRGLSLC